MQLGVHTVRLTAPGDVTPEGVHSDGYQFVLSTVIAREGITGGHSLVHSAKHAPPMLDVPMAAGDALLINDRDIFHSVSPIRVANGFSRGHRDVILITGRPWPTDTDGNLVDDVQEHLQGLEGFKEAPEAKA